MNVPVRQTSTLAIISLVFGIVGWVMLPVIASIVAVITGHMARSEIRREPERLEGGGLALAGLILGYSMIALVVAGVLIFFLFLGGMAWFANYG